MSDRILDKIKALLTKTVASGCSEAEAASAASLAQRLMLDHAISEDKLRASGETVVDESITTEMLDPGQLKAMGMGQWEATLADRMAKTFGCYVFWRGTTVYAVGRPTDRACLLLVWEYLCAQVHQLGAEGYRRQGQYEDSSPTRWRKAFYHGCVESLSHRMRMDQQKLVVGQAIVLHDRYQAVQAAVDAMKIEIVSVKQKPKTGGYWHGREVGESMPLDLRRPDPRVKRLAEPKRLSVAEQLRARILAGETDEQVFAWAVTNLGFDDSKKGYPRWYRNELRKKGLL